MVKGKEVNHFRQQTAPAGRRQLPEVGGLIELSCAACHSLPPSFQSGCSFRDRRLMWPVVSWLFLTPEPLTFPPLAREEKLMGPGCYHASPPASPLVSLTGTLPAMGNSYSLRNNPLAQAAYSPVSVADTNTFLPCFSRSINPSFSSRVRMVLSRRISCRLWTARRSSRLTSS